MSKPFKSLDSLLRLMRKRNITIEKGTEGSRVKRILARDRVIGQKVLLLMPMELVKY